MTVTPWVLKGTEYGVCNCDYGCPCQFNGRPSSPNGDCRAAQFTQVDEGRYGNLKLDGLRFAWLAGWPGPVHEGGGEFQLIIDERADDAQRDAIRHIVYNEDSDETLSHYAVFLSVCTTVYEPIVAPIELEFDVEARTAHAEVPGVVVADAEPVRNPVTGAPHRAQIVLPEGFAATKMETASGSAQATGAIPLDFAHRFASFSELHMTDQGIVRE